MDKYIARWFSPLPLPEEMRLWDADATALGLPQETLMENAARAALAVLQQYHPLLDEKCVVLVMGSGNNGGDAACLARILLDVGAKPIVLHTRPLTNCKGACGKHVRLARACGVPFRRCPTDINILGLTPDILVDGLLGTGLRGTLKPETQSLVQAINHMAAPFVLALDIPSGLDGILGIPLPEAVRATATVSFQAAKPGLLQPGAAMWTGTVHVRDIGIPTKTQSTAPCSQFLVDGQCISPLAVSRQKAFKNSYGHVLIIGGSPGLGGAAHLAARAALRTGAGLVTVAAPAPALHDIKNGWPEIMTHALTAMPSATWPDVLTEKLTAFAGRCSSWVVGPGIGRGEDAATFLAALLHIPFRPPTIFDADALVLLARCPMLLTQISAKDVLTPHPGEAAMILGSTAKEVQLNRMAALQRLCTLCPAVVVLKGAGTLVGQTQKPILLCPYDLPQLSMGGAGDVLAGCIGALLARAETTGDDVDADPCATLLHVGQAVALHALAGKSLSRQWPLRGNTASELADALPRSMATYGLRRQAKTDALPWPR